MDYIDFLRAKIPLANFDGYDIALDEINPILKPHQKAVVQWAVKGGNRCQHRRKPNNPTRPTQGGFCFGVNMETEYLTSQQCADMLAVKKRTFLERIAPRPDFPARIAVSKKIFWWKKEEVALWLERQKEKRPAI